MKNWTFGRKLGLGFAVVVLLSTLMGVTSYWALEQVVDRQERLVQQTAENLIDAESALTALQREVANARGFLLTGERRFKEGRASANAQFDEAFTRTTARGLQAKSKSLVDEIKIAARAHDAAIERVIKLREGSETPAAVVSAFETTAMPAYDKVAEPVREFVSAERAMLTRQQQEARDLASSATRGILAIDLVVIVLAILIALYLSRTLNSQIGSTVQQVRSSSAELQAAATQQASASKEQASSMSEISTTIGELLVTSRQIAESAQRVSRIAGDTAQGAHHGDDSVREATAAVESIRDQVDVIVRHMLDLGRKSQQIGSILEIINELSEQTNILAINATIEAAGAGESGRRFAVVGDEIRKLADRVSGSTKEIRALIEEIRAAVNATVMATEAGAKTVDTGRERFDELATAFQRIGALVETTTEAAREIELSTKQQSSAVEQVNTAIAGAAQATKETEASAAQTVQTSSQLATLSDGLSRLVQAAS